VNEIKISSLDYHVQENNVGAIVSQDSIVVEGITTDYRSASERDCYSALKTCDANEPGRTEWNTLAATHYEVSITSS
jgi:hypothetical protein